jgi:hypothetical protein
VLGQGRADDGAGAHSDDGSRGARLSQLEHATCILQGGPWAVVGVGRKGLQPGLGHGLGGEGTAVGVDEVRLKELLGEGVLRGEDVVVVGVGAGWCVLTGAWEWRT